MPGIRRERPYLGSVDLPPEGECLQAQEGTLQGWKAAGAANEGERPAVEERSEGTVPGLT